MFTGYLSVSSIVVLWLMLGYVCFSYLIRIVVFFNRYRCLNCCTILSGNIFLQFLLLWRYFFVLSVILLFTMVGLVLKRGCVYLLLDVDTVRYFVLYCFCPPCCDHVALLKNKKVCADLYCVTFIENKSTNKYIKAYFNLIYPPC